jgi:hypothetical protein
MIRPAYVDPFNPTMRSSESLELSVEQNNLIRQVLDYSSSDSLFAKKAYDAIQRILTQGSVLLPIINSLNPDTAVLGSESFDIHVMGEGFDVDAKIIWNELEEPTTRISENELTTGVNMGTANNAVGVPVMVRNGSGLLSNSMIFTFTEAANAEGQQSERMTDSERERIKTNNEANKKAHLESPGVFDNNLKDRSFDPVPSKNDFYKRDPEKRLDRDKEFKRLKESKGQMFLPFEESNEPLKKSMEQNENRLEHIEKLNRDEELKRYLESLKRERESAESEKREGL